MHDFFFINKSLTGEKIQFSTIIWGQKEEEYPFHPYIIAEGLFHHQTPFYYQNPCHVLLPNNLKGSSNAVLYISPEYLLSHA